MKKTPLPQIIKWVVSGAMHPIALFDRCKDKPRPLVSATYEEFRHLYKTQAHFDRHVLRISLKIRPLNLFIIDPQMDFIHKGMNFFPPRSSVSPVYKIFEKEIIPFKWPDPLPGKRSVLEESPLTTAQRELAEELGL